MQLVSGNSTFRVMEEGAEFDVVGPRYTWLWQNRSVFRGHRSTGSTV